ncbi:DNA damage-regulated autophagy modulator protein 1 isoform X3 [Vanacampus margaritifer]
MWWFTQGLCFLPVFLVAWSSSTFILPYVIAVLRRDVDVLFPYIRRGHRLLQVQVCGEAERGDEGGEPTPEQDGAGAGNARLLGNERGGHVPGDDGDGGSRYGGLALLRHGRPLHPLAVRHFLPLLPVRLIRGGVSGAAGCGRHRLAGILPDCHLCIFREAKGPAQRCGKRGLSLPRGQRRVRVDRGLQLRLLLPHIH